MYMYKMYLLFDNLQTWETNKAWNKIQMYNESDHNNVTMPIPI